jgi:hypothetical protein
VKIDFAIVIKVQAVKLVRPKASATVMTRFCLFMITCVFFTTPTMTLETHSDCCAAIVANVSTTLARCTGSASCRACTNCSRCHFCNSGGSCGVCSGYTSSEIEYTERAPVKITKRVHRMYEVPDAYFNETYVHLAPYRPLNEYVFEEFDINCFSKAYQKMNNNSSGIERSRILPAASYRLIDIEDYLDSAAFTDDNTNGDSVALFVYVSDIQEDKVRFNGTVKSYLLFTLKQDIKSKEKLMAVLPPNLMKIQRLAGYPNTVAGYRSLFKHKFVRITGFASARISPQPNSDCLQIDLQTLKLKTVPWLIYPVIDIDEWDYVEDVEVTD